MHALLEYIPLVIFFAVYKFVDIYWATASLIISSALQIAYFLVKRQPVPKKNWIFFALIAVFGTLTIVLQDDNFLKWKVTIINMVFAAALLISQYAFKKNLIKQLLTHSDASLNLPDNVWRMLNLSWAIFFIGCAVLNLYVAYNFSQETWVNFKIFGLTGLTLVFTLMSVLALHKYMPSEESVKTIDK